ncbi:spore coat U domain-containing protein [Cupriavidus sp. 30B13]|uniref:Csu type fimbrial protein n=1 Tax=Cupriavidus sp. 30B13 TaxID=3384241 RepID=UPI003B8FBF13
MKRLHGTWRRCLAPALLGLLLSPPARASCSAIAGSPASFGTVGSFAARTQPLATSTVNSGLTCTGAVAGFLILGDQINAVITSANQGSLAGPGGDTIPYRIYADPQGNVPLNINTGYNWATGQLANFLGVFGGPSKALPLYLRTLPANASIAAGTYTDTATIYWQWGYCAGIGVLGACLGRDAGGGRSAFALTLTVTNDCLIGASDIDFGAAPTVTSFAPVSGSLSLTCTKGMVFTVGLSGGNFPAPDGRRQMASGARRLQYDIFGPAGTVWGAGAGRAGSGGPADGISAKSFPYTARIYADQPTPPAGTYVDSVIVDVRY